MLPLRSGVQMDVRGEPGRPAGAARQELAGKVERDAVDVGSQQEPEPAVATRHEGERREEMLAELAVGLPRLVGSGPLERERVDHDRPSAQKLDVVGARIAERHPVLAGERLRRQGQQRGILQLRERPFERVGDEADLLGPDHGHGPGLEGQIEGRRLVRDQDALGQQGGVEAGGLEGGPVIGEALIHLPIEDAAATEDEPAGVAVGARLALRGRAGAHSGRVGEAPLSSGAALSLTASPLVGLRRNRPIVERMALRKKNGIDTMVAMMAWMTRLPAPGSMYAKTSLMTTP